MNKYDIAVIAGDGIGTEVMVEGLRVLDAVSTRFGFELDYTHYDWNCDYYKQHGRMMPTDGIARLRDSDAIFFGAVGHPDVPDHVSVWELILPIRREFDQYVNLRPVRLLPGLPCPLAGKQPGDIDFWIVRENTEGEYSQLGGRMFADTEREFVTQQAVFTRHGTDRIQKYAFELARRLGREHVTSATKSNGIFYSMPYWDERFAAMAKNYPDISVDQFHIDILTARLVMTPEHFDVIVGSNLFGAILSDLGPGVTGTIAVAPGGNINPERNYPSMFEPVHGSAPDIAGQGIANPIGQIWSASLMLDHLGEAEAAAAIMQALDTVLADDNGPRTPDLGGRAKTTDLGQAIAQAVAEAGEHDEL